MPLVAYHWEYIIGIKKKKDSISILILKELKLKLKFYITISVPASKHAVKEHKF